MLNTGCTFIARGSSKLAMLCPIICSTLNSPMYLGQSFSGFTFSFSCFVDNSTLSPGLKLDYLLTLLAHCLSASTCFVNRWWTSVYNLYNSRK